MHVNGRIWSRKAKALEYDKPGGIKMADLVLTRCSKEKIIGNAQANIKIDAEAFSLVLEVAEETGLPLKQSASLMIKHAYKEIRFKPMERLVK